MFTADKERTTFVNTWHSWSEELECWTYNGYPMVDPWMYNTSEAARWAFIVSVVFDVRKASVPFDVASVLRHNNVTHAECLTLRQLLPIHRARWAYQQVSRYENEITPMEV